MPKQTVGRAGVGVRRMEFRWLMTGLVIMVIGLFVAWLAMTGRLTGLGLAGLASLLVFATVIVAALKRVDKRTEQMDRGATAEEAVERVLATLDDSCHVIHDVVLPVGRGNIDHVVVTPSGIYTIETKSHKGTVTFENDRLLLNGHAPEKDFLSQAYAEAMALKEYLVQVSNGQSHFVEPLVVFTRGFVKVRGKAKGVRVLSLKWLTGELTRGAERIPPEKREAITRSLKHLTAEAKTSA